MRERLKINQIPKLREIDDFGLTNPVGAWISWYQYYDLRPVTPNGSRVRPDLNLIQIVQIKLKKRSHFVICIRMFLPQNVIKGVRWDA